MLYAGTHGISQGLTSVADAAARLAGEPAIRFAFVGEGADKAAAGAAGSPNCGLGHVTLLPGVPHEQVPALLAAADICLVPLRDVPLFSSFIPSKMFEYLAAGKPVVGALAGEAAQILREAGAWWCRRGTARPWRTRSGRWPPTRRGGRRWAGRAAATSRSTSTAAALARQYRKLLDAPGSRR